LLFFLIYYLLFITYSRATEPVNDKQTSLTSRSKGTLYGCSLAGSSVRGKRFRKLIPAGDGVTLDVPCFKISSIINKRERG